MVEVRYFAGAADAAGCAHEIFDLPGGSTLAALKAAVQQRHGSSVTDVLRVSAFLVGDDLTRDPATTLGDRVDVLPPFAGG
ncbi:molybdopterin synthase sulfur carrier subunit [Rhodococcus sp. 14-2470-1b]|uniref:MoaD/ThiS family protein n=1 Tax=Rhodococcus sp. 14-2470-1b TaxID=2023149 RepID=UPI000B9BDBC4|nr:MoaD/ThiS family protein [Rhodococcus sp. 14-2470-1b]OZF58502.1 molybdopterin synthase sulfur carrier subunit [Rhodococcus sp. 14-2470-1b]